MPVVEGGNPTHTTLQSRDIQRSFRFYTEVAGLWANIHRVLHCHIQATNGHQAAVHQRSKVAPQPLLNFYTRPVRTPDDVDHAYRGIAAIQEEHGIDELTGPEQADPSDFGIDTYGFYLKEADGNWWRIEEDRGPFGPMLDATVPEHSLSIIAQGPISYVTLECRDLARTERFYNDFLGLETRKLSSRSFACACSGRGVNVVAVEVGDKVVNQPVNNHHGITLQAPPSKIDELRDATQRYAADFGIGRMTPCKWQHGSYSFYLQDRDTNWWEIEIRGESHPLREI